jgi:chromosome segregation ATPase
MADEMTVLRDRQDKVEGRVTLLEGTVEREAALRAKMDEDQSNITAILGAHTRSLQALHDTQQDHTGRLTRIEDGLGNVEGRLGNVEGRLGNVEIRLGHVEDDLVMVKEKLDTVHIGVHAVLDLLDTHLARKSRLNLARLLRRARPPQQDDPAGGR